LLELTIATAALMLTAGMTMLAVNELRNTADQTATTSGVQESAERAIGRVADLLARSGFLTSGGYAYPHLFVDGSPGTGFQSHAHDAPHVFNVVAGGSVTQSWSREIVFLRPFDGDAAGQPGHGVPDLDGNGNLVWDPVEWSLVVVPDDRGGNVLELRADAEFQETLASGVESFVCTDTAIAGPTVPMNSILVELTLRGLDGDGRLARYTARAIVRMRNG
jgi:hypothetical protein